MGDRRALYSGSCQFWRWPHGKWEGSDVKVVSSSLSSHLTDLLPCAIVASRDHAQKAVDDWGLHLREKTHAFCLWDKPKLLFLQETNQNPPSPTPKNANHKILLFSFECELSEWALGILRFCFSFFCFSIHMYAVGEERKKKKIIWQNKTNYNQQLWNTNLSKSVNVLQLYYGTELRSCVKVDVAILGSLSLIVCTVYGCKATFSLYYCIIMHKFAYFEKLVTVLSQAYPW